MTTWRFVFVVLLLFFAPLAQAADAAAYLGFDRNDYPGDDHLQELHKSFAYTGYWLNNPPGEKTNTWVGKRARFESAGFGFLVLFNGRLYRELKTHAGALGRSDARAATAAAKREGFPAQTIIFLDQEEGGRLLPEQKAYLFAWIDGVTAAGFRAGVYCSGMPAQEVRRRGCHYGRRYQAERGRAQNFVLGNKRRLPPVTRLHETAASSSTSGQWS